MEVYTIHGQKGVLCRQESNRSMGKDRMSKDGLVFIGIATHVHQGCLLAIYHRPAEDNTYSLERRLIWSLLNQLLP